MTTTPRIDTVLMSARIASTAAPSAPFLSPRPTQRPAAIAPASVTRASSSARFRSGAWRSGSAVMGGFGWPVTAAVWSSDMADAFPRGRDAILRTGSGGLAESLGPHATGASGAVRRGLERRGGVAGIGLFGQGGGEPRPSALQPLQADSGEMLAPFPELERFLQGEPSTLQPPDHLDELVARLLVGHLGGGRAPTGLVATGLTTGVLATGGLPGGRLAAHRAAAAL